MSVFFRTSADLRQHLDRLGLFHIDMGLQRMHRALTSLHLVRPPYITVQVLGTNGKGSTATFLASLAQAHGCRTGLYTSPHFVSPAERIRMGAPFQRSLSPYPLEQWVDAANDVMVAAPDLTYFEFCTVLALEIFRRQRVRIAVLEAGLGGRHDATTAVVADALCYAPIAMDHADVLGSSLQAIAADKAAAIRSQAPVFSTAQFPAAAAALAAAASHQRAPLAIARPVSASLSLGIDGPHQYANAGLALAAWRSVAPLLNKPVNDSQAQIEGLRRAHLPGRFQHVPPTADHPPLLLDGAHNPHGMATLLSALRATHIHPAAAVYACLRDKDWQPTLRLLCHALVKVPLLLVPLHNARAAPVDDVARVCARIPGVQYTPLSNPNALSMLLSFAHDLPGVALDRPLLVTGSLYLLGEFFALYPRYMTE